MEPSAKTVRVKRMSEECLQNLQMQVNFDPKYSTVSTMSPQFMHDMHGSMHEQLCMSCKTATKFKKHGDLHHQGSITLYCWYVFCMFHTSYDIRYHTCICYVCYMYCIPPITRLDCVKPLQMEKVDAKDMPRHPDRVSSCWTSELPYLQQKRFALCTMKFIW